MGRQQVESRHPRLDLRRHCLHPQNGGGARRRLRDGEKNHAARLRKGKLSCAKPKAMRGGEPPRDSFSPPGKPPMSAVPDRKPDLQPAFLAVSNVEVIYDHVILVL